MVFSDWLSGSYFILQASKFLFINVTAVTLGQGHQKVIQLMYYWVKIDESYKEFALPYSCNMIRYETLLHGFCPHFTLEINHFIYNYFSYIYGSVQDCSNSSALAKEILQSCTKPLICPCLISYECSPFLAAFGFAGFPFDFAFFPEIRIIINLSFVALKTKYSVKTTIKHKRALVGNKLPDHSDVVGASTVGTAPTTSSFST